MTTSSMSNNDSSGIDDDVKPGASGSNTTNEKKRKWDAAAEASTSAVATWIRLEMVRKLKKSPVLYVVPPCLLLYVRTKKILMCGVPANANCCGVTRPANICQR